MGQTKITLNGEEFVCGGITVTPEQDIECHPKEFRWEFFPDEYGGIAIPIPVDPHDREPVVVGQQITGEASLSPDAIRHLWSLEDGDEVILVDIGVPELGVTLGDVCFEGPIPVNPTGITDVPFLAGKIIPDDAQTA